jgi:hypothetical protein
MVPHDTAPSLVKEIRALAPVVLGTPALGAPLAMDFSMTYGPPACHNELYVHSWSQDHGEVQHDLMDKIMRFAVPASPSAAQRRRPRRGVRLHARRHLPLPPRGGRW